MKILSILTFRSLLFIIIFGLLSIIIKTNLLELSKYWTLVVLFVNIITILILFSICKKEKITYIELIKYKKGNNKISIVILFSLITIIIGISGMYLAGLAIYNEFPYLPIIMVKPINIILSIIVLLFLPITTTLAEDGLYLGIGVNKIKNKYCAILIPAFFYAIQHSFIPLLLDFNFIVYRFLSFLPLTIIFCVYYYYKRNPLPLMVGHFFINIATVIQIFIFSLFPEMLESMINMNH